MRCFDDSIRWSNCGNFRGFANRTLDSDGLLIIVYNRKAQLVKTFPEHPVPDESWRQFNKSCPFPATVPKRTTVWIKCMLLKFPLNFPGLTDFNIELVLKLGQNWRTENSNRFWKKIGRRNQNEDNSRDNLVDDFSDIQSVDKYFRLMTRWTGGWNNGWKACLSRFSYWSK